MVAPPSRLVETGGALSPQSMVLYAYPLGYIELPVQDLNNQTIAPPMADPRMPIHARELL